MTNNGMGMSENDKRIAALREAIKRAFPAEPYTGTVTPCDESLEDPDLDSEKNLYEGLKGRRWTDVSQQLLDSEPDGYVLLTDEAFAAFLASWLTRSLDNMGGANEVREFVVYAFSPKHDMAPDTTDLVLRRLRFLSSGQREALRSLLMEFAETEGSGFRRKLASEAVVLIDSVS